MTAVTEHWRLYCSLSWVVVIHGVFLEVQRDENGPAKGYWHTYHMDPHTPTPIATHTHWYMLSNMNSLLICTMFIILTLWLTLLGEVVGDLQFWVIFCLIHYFTCVVRFVQRWHLVVWCAWDGTTVTHTQSQDRHRMMFSLTRSIKMHWRQRLERSPVLDLLLVR